MTTDDGGEATDGGETAAYADLGATTEDAMEIAETSMDRVHELVAQETPTDRLRAKAVHATGDPEFAHLMRFANDPVAAGAKAVLDERPIVTDITMVKSGVTGRGHHCEVRKAIGNGAELAAETGMTRTAASVLELDECGVYDDAIAVVGFETVVDFVRDRTDADCLTYGYRDEADALTDFADRVAHGERSTAVLMGDPNHSGYQFVGKVERAVDDATGGSVDVRVVPGVSSLQVAASRARTRIEDTTFVTLHKSGDLTDGMDRLRRDVGKRHLLVLPRPFDRMPGDIAADLLEHGGDPETDALVCERLTRDDERITRTTLGELAERAGGEKPADSPFSDLSVLVVRR